MRIKNSLIAGLGASTVGFGYTLGLGLSFIFFNLLGCSILALLVYKANIYDDLLNEAKKLNVLNVKVQGDKR